MPPDQSLAKEGQSGFKGVKACITILVTINDDGTHKCHLTFIGQARHLQLLKREGGCEACNLNYLWNPKAWTLGFIFAKSIFACD